MFCFGERVASVYFTMSFHCVPEVGLLALPERLALLGSPKDMKLLLHLMFNVFFLSWWVKDYTKSWPCCSRKFIDSSACLFLMALQADTTSDFPAIGTSAASCSMLDGFASCLYSRGHCQKTAASKTKARMKLTGEILLEAYVVASALERFFHFAPHRVHNVPEPLTQLLVPRFNFGPLHLR